LNPHTGKRFLAFDETNITVEKHFLRCCFNRANIQPKLKMGHFVSLPFKRINQKEASKAGIQI